MNFNECLGTYITFTYVLEFDFKQTILVCDPTHRIYWS